MTDKSEQKWIAGIDIGSTNIRCVIAVKDEPNAPIRIAGTSIQPSKGIKDGSVIDLAIASESIREVITQAESLAGTYIDEIIVGLNPRKIVSFDSYGVVPVKGDAVQEEDLELLVDSTRDAKQISRKILHILPQGFVLNRRQIRNPLGMTGKRLEGRFHLITCTHTSVNHIVDAVQHADLDVVDILFSPIASCAALLHKGNISQRVCVIDFGGSATNFVLCKDGHVMKSGVVPYGGKSVTSDISQIFDVSPSSAERIKLAYSEDEKITEGKLSHLNEEEKNILKDSKLAAVIEARVEEIFLDVKKELIQNGYLDEPTECLLTGGSSMTLGLLETVGNVLDLPVSIGSVAEIQSVTEDYKHPTFSSCVGLILFSETFQDWRYFSPDNIHKSRPKGLFEKVLLYIKENM